MSKIKLVPCPTITKRELMTALMDGRKFTTDKELHDSPVSYGDIHWDDNFGDSPVRQGTERWNWRGFKYLHELVEQQWYEDPEMIGKAVRVRDNEDSGWLIEIYKGYREGHDYEYETDQTIRMFAEPLTSEVIYQEQV